MAHSKQIAETVDYVLDDIITELGCEPDGHKTWAKTTDEIVETIKPILTEAFQTAERRGRLFNDQELEIMWIDYKSLVATTKMMNRQVVGDKKLEFVLDANDQVREEILAKLKPYMPASLKPTSEEKSK